MNSSMEKNKIIEELQIELKEIKAYISDLRKKGADVSLADMKIKSIPSKIVLAKITGEKEDAEKVKTILSDTKKELNTTIEEFKRQKEEEEKLKFNEEVNKDKTIDTTAIQAELHGTQTQEKELKIKINGIINKAEQSIIARNKKEAAEYYRNIVELYKKLPKEAQIECLKRCTELKKDIEDMKTRD